MKTSKQIVKLSPHKFPHLVQITKIFVRKIYGIYSTSELLFVFHKTEERLILF